MTITHLKIFTNKLKHLENSPTTRMLSYVLTICMRFWFPCRTSGETPSDVQHQHENIFKMATRGTVDKCSL